MAGQAVRQPQGAKPRLFYGYIVVVAAFAIVLLSAGTYLAFGVFFKPLLTEFGWTRAMTSGAFSLSWVVQGSLGIVMGGLTDRFGPRLVLTISGFLLGLGYLLMSQVGAAWQIYLFYGVIIGAGMSGIIIPLFSTVVRWFVKRRTVIVGTTLSGTGIGMLITPPVANWLISRYDWRVSYVVLGSIVSAVVILAAQFLKRDPAAVGAVPYGEGEGVEPGVKSQTRAFSLKEAMHTRQFWLVFAIFCCIGFPRQSITVHLVPHATELGISSSSAATILATVGGFSIITRVLMGMAADRIGNRQVFIVCFILMSAALFWLVPATQAWMLYVFAVAFSFAFGITASESPLVAEFFGLGSLGLIFGIMGFGHTVGAAIGPFVTGYIFDITGGYQAAFLVCAAIGVAGLILTLLLTPTETR